MAAVKCNIRMTKGSDNMADKAWELSENTFSTRTSKAWEGLFTLGSGYLHTRGSLEEHLHDDPQNVSFLRMPANVTAEKQRETKAKWGTFVPGLFGPHPTLNNEMVNLPWFLELTPCVAGEKLDMEASRIEGYRRWLDLRAATLHRELVWKTKAGAVVRIRFERFISAARPALSVQRLVLSSDRDVDVELRAGIDADVRTSGFDHLTEFNFTREDDRTLSCRIKTNGGDTVSMAARLSADTTWRYGNASRRAWQEGHLRVFKGNDAVIEKRCAVTTSRDPGRRDPISVLQEANGMRFAALHAEHMALWEERWQRSDVVIDGDETTQMAIRVSIFHLLRTHVPGDDRVAVDAKGYAGDAYFGRFFWDTEMYLLPFYLYTDPARAKTFCDFRVQSLLGARQNAKRYGYRGARYAWESDSRGIDGCPNWQYGDHEVHITADVVYGMAHYARAADPSYLQGPAATVIVETARYWLDRIDRRPDGSPALLGVMGPNEYTPISNNNAYTNWMVAFSLRLAAEVGPHGGASHAECEEFRRVADGLPIPRKGNLVLQCDGFDELADPRFDTLWPDRTRGFANQVSQERLYRTKCLKQADTIMLMSLFPDQFTDAECRAAWDYYLPLTTHDSSLSAGIHAIMALRLGFDGDAWDYFQDGLYKDVDVEHGGAAEGIHIAGCGCNWMVVVFGFAGLRSALLSDRLTLQPRMPRTLMSIAFPLVWKGSPVYVEITQARCTVTNRDSRSLAVSVCGQDANLKAGESHSFKIG
jgi:kojibiose phosphorylase